MNRSRLALTFTLEKLAEEEKVLGFWTFTTWTAQDIGYAIDQWAIVGRSLVRLGWRFVRVFEMHETHGLHVHVVGGWWPIEIVHNLVKDTVFGRVHVERVSDLQGAVAYVSKYLQKDREPCLRGRRIWAACGMKGWSGRSRVRDVRIYDPAKKVVCELLTERRFSVIDTYRKLTAATGDGQ